MKAVLLCVLVFVAVFGRAQNLQYEQAAYADNAAPAPLEQVQEQPMTNQDGESEASFAEVDDAAEPGALSERAHKVGAAIQKVKNLFRSRKNKGGNISPSAPPKTTHKKRTAVKNAVKKVVGKVVGKFLSKNKKPAAAPKRNAALKSLGSKKQLKRPIIAKKKPSASKRPATRPSKRPAVRPAGRKPRRPIRVPRAPPAARGPVDDLFHSERMDPPKGSENRDPEMAKLNLALEAVKEDILSTNKQINDERRWVIAVGKIIKSYNTKMARVEQHIIALRKEMKALYRKKKQIENLKLQKALEAKLKEAKAELVTLTNSLKHVAKKQGELNKSGRDLRQTIAGIQGQLAKLRGQQMLKKCKRGTKYSRKAKKCVSICKAGQLFNAKSKKCVSRCRKGTKWSPKARKCLKARAKRAKRASRK